MPSKGERLRRRARELRAWLELGDASLEEAEEIFTDVQLRSRLSDPLGFYEAAALGGEPLPAEAAALATKAASHLGVSQAVSEDLLRLLAEDRLSGSPVLHAAGIFEVLELNTPGVFAELAGLLHAEQCEALQALAAILRGAHDDGHAFGAQCRELAQKLLSEGLEKTLWDSYTKVSGCPRFSPGSEHGEVERMVKEGLSLQLCVLECLVLAKYDSQINRSDPEQICRMTEEFFRQRFLGSLPKAAHQHHWLLGDSEICFRAQCVGDLCLTLLLEAFCLEEVAAQPEQAVARHVFLASSVHMKHLQQLIEGSWLDICHHAAHPKEATPALVHCGRCVALVALGWAVLVGSVPESYRETHGLGFQRLTSSAVFQSRHLLSDAAGSLQARAFLMLDGPNALHMAPRAVFRGLVAAASAAFHLEGPGPMAATHLALSKLASISYEGDAAACVEFWRSDYEKREGSFHVLHSWLMGFPRHLPDLLGLLAGLASGGGALFVAELLQAPLNSLQLPYRLLRHLTDFEESPCSSSRPPRGTRIVLRGSAYVEELALRLLALELPEWYVENSLVLPAGSQGLLAHDRPQDSQSSSQSHLVRWTLPSPGVSIWRISLAAWDAILLGRKAGTSKTEGKELLCELTRCLSNVLIASPDSWESLLKELPREEPGAMGMVARLLATFFTLAGSEDESARPLLGRLLLALRSACQAPGAAQALLRLLEGEATAFGCSSVGDFLGVLTGLADAEREAGAYPATCAALELIRALLEACPVELLVLPWAVHQSLGLPSFAAPGSEGPATLPKAEEVLGPLLDFSFGVFSRCHFWPCRSLSERFAVAERCLGVASALLPALEVFNWPEAAGLSSRGDDLARALSALRALQLRLLRSFGEVSFVQNVLQCVLCDIVYGPAPGDASLGRPFVGFRSPALQVQIIAPTPGDGATLPTLAPSTGASLVTSALQVLRRLMALVLGPAGFAPHYQPLAEHLIEHSSVRESLGPLPASRNQSSQGMPSGRADLVQSLYAHICCAEASVAEGAAECLASLSALWCRADMRHAQLDGAVNVGGRARLLASLSVPSASPTEEAAQATPAASLSTHLSKRLSAVLGDSDHPRSFRCAAADAARAALAAQPGLLTEPTAFVKSAGMGLAGILEEVTPVKDPADAKRFCFVCLALLDGLAAADDSLISSSFESPLESKPSAGISKSHSSMWKLLTKVFSDALRPWLSGKAPWSPHTETNDHEAPLAPLAAAALLRLTERGCAKAQASSSTLHEDLLALLKELLSPQTLDLLHPLGAKEGGAGASAGSASGEAQGPKPELSREVSFAATSKVVVTATGVSADFEMLQQPYGDRLPEGCLDRFESLLGQLELRKEALAPQTSAACAAARGALAAHQWLASNSGSPGAVSQDLAAQLEAKGIGSAPSCFRSWGQLCEIACGVALDVPNPTGGRGKRRGTLPQERIGCFGSRENCALAHCGSDIVDGYVVSANLMPLHKGSVRFAAIIAVAHGFARGGRGPCEGSDDPVLQALRALLAELQQVSSYRATGAAAVPLALEAFDDLLVTTARLSRAGSPAASQVEGLVSPLAWGLTYQLHHSMQKMGRLMENPRSFASLLALTAQTFALQPQGSALAAPSKAFGPFTTRNEAGSLGNERSGYLKEMLTQETTAGLALVAQLMVALRAAAGKAQSSLPPRAASLLASAGFLSAGAEAHAGVLDSSSESGSAFAEVVLHVLSLLLQLVPALGRAPSGASRSSLQAVPLLTGLVEVLAQLLDNFAAVEQARERARQSQAVLAASQRRAAAAPQEAAEVPASDPVPGWPARAPVSAAGASAVQVLQRPGDAAVREASEIQAEKLDDVLRSGFICLVLALSERTLTALRARAGDQRGPQEVLLSRLLTCSFCAFAASPNRIGNAPDRKAASLSVWSRADEAAMASRLDATVGVLLRVAQTPSGAALLAERRIFQLLAFCPLLREFVLSNESSYVVPANSIDGTPLVMAEKQRRNLLAAWRRPAHSSWCRVLLLVATILSSVSAPSGAEHFLQVYRERFCFVFQTNLQSGRLAALEEATLMARVLAFLSNSCSLAQSLATDASLRAMIFIMASCLTERSSPSEVFLPISAEERAAALVQQVAVDGDSTSAQVPSIFHQRVEYLGLEVTRSLLLALLRISSSPQWALGRASQVTGSVALPPPAPGWPTAYQSVFGLKNAGGNAALGSETDVLRFWAALMDVVLEAGRKALEVLETLRGTRQELNRLLISSCAPPGNKEEGDAWLPLSLALVGVGEQSTGDGSQEETPGFSPSKLAKGLTPMAAPLSPTTRAASPILGPGETRTGPRVSRNRSMRFKFAARKPHSMIGGQQPTAAPEGVTLDELRDLASSVVELSCTLLCRFCQAMKSGGFGASQASPGVAVLHGLLSFLHEVLDSSESGPSALDEGTAEFLQGLRAGAEMQLRNEEVKAFQHAGTQPNPVFDGDAWVLGEA